MSLTTIAHRLALPALLGLLVLSACGDDEKEAGQPGEGRGTERAAVERAAREYVVEQQADEDDTERPDAISIEQVEIDGEQAEVRARSTLTGNRYEANLRKQGPS